MSQRFDVIILDLMIPGEPGMVLLVANNFALQARPINRPRVFRFG